MAQELLRSGEYIDSRELFQTSDALLRSLSKSIATSTSNASIKSVTQVSQATPTPQRQVSSNDVPLLATPPVRIQSRTLTSSQASIANTLKKTSTESLKLTSNSDSIKKAINAQLEAAEKLKEQENLIRHSASQSKKTSIETSKSTSSAVVEATNPFTQKVIELQNLIEEQKQIHGASITIDADFVPETRIEIVSPIKQSAKQLLTTALNDAPLSPATVISNKLTPVPAKEISLQEIHSASTRQTPIQSKKNSQQSQKISQAISSTQIPDGYVAKPATHIGYHSSSSRVTQENAHETINHESLNQLLQQQQHLSSATSKKSSMQSQKLDLSSSAIKFEDTNLGDYKYDPYLDPFTSDMFKDEIIDIDYGAIDAFNSLLNAQFNKELADHANLTNNKNDNKNVFASNLVRSDYGSFIENQLALGDSLLNINNDPALTLLSFDEYKTYYDKHGSSSLIDIRPQANKQALVIEDVPNELSGQLSLDDLSGALNSVLMVNNGSIDNKAKILNELKSLIKTKQFLSGTSTTLAH